jgi:hypothetical protein
MKKLELLYLPYYVHKVSISQGGEEYEMVVCTDGICSGFSHFNSAEMTFTDKASGVVALFMVSDERARRSCLENLRWHLVRQGLRLKVKAQVEEIRDTRRIYYPYWVGYFKRTSGYDFRAADAVTGEIQGVQMRSVFLTAFSQIDSVNGGHEADVPRSHS